MSFDEILQSDEIELIREHAFESERKKRLSDDVLDLIYRKNWLRIAQPVSIGGLEWSLPKMVRLFEALAFADGNLGWCVNLGAGANMFSGYLPEKTAREIFRSEKVWCAGSGAATGKAIEHRDGYRVSGYWKYASGAAHATHFTANCYLFDKNEEPIMEQGIQAFRSVIIPADQVDILQTWEVTGLKASSSNDFEVRDVYLPKDSVFDLKNPSPFAAGSLFAFPFQLLAVVNMAAMPMGIAAHFIGLFEELMQQKRPLHHDKVLGLEAKLSSYFGKLTTAFYRSRAEFYKLLDGVWASHEASSLDIASERILAEAARKAAAKAKELVDGLLQFCGMSVVFTDSPLNKVWRDFSVASQHYLLSPLYKYEG